MSIRLAETASPDIIEVAGRGELQLSVLIESMRREGYELQVSRPEVIVREINGKRHEPLERAVIDVPDEHVGTVTQALAPRKGKVTDLRPGDTGRTHRQHRGPQPRPHRVPLAAAHRHPRHRPHAPAPRRLDPVGRRPAGPQGRRHDRRPAGHRRPATPSTTCRRGASSSSARAQQVYEGMVVGENAKRRRHDRQRRAREAEDQHPHPRRGRGHQAHARPGCSPSRRPSSSSPTTSWSR